MSKYTTQIKSKETKVEIFFTFESEKFYKQLKENEKLKTKNLDHVEFIGFNDKLLTIKTIVNSQFKDIFTTSMDALFNDIHNENNSGIDFILDMMKDYQQNAKNNKERRNVEAFIEGLRKR